MSRLYAPWRLTAVAAMAGGVAISAPARAAGMAEGSIGTTGWLVLTSLFVLVLAFIAMFYSIWSHRKSSGENARHFHRRLSVEMAWNAVPVLILVLAAYPAAKSGIETGLEGATASKNETGTQRVASADPMLGQPSYKQ